MREITKTTFMLGLYLILIGFGLTLFETDSPDDQEWKEEYEITERERKELENGHATGIEGVRSSDRTAFETTTAH